MEKKTLPLWNSGDDLVHLAEEATEPPPPPPGGIPRQKVPSWVRWPIRALFLPFVLLDQACKRIASLFFRFPYKREGSCKQRGNCCYYIVIPAPNSILTKLYYFWNTEINGFFPRHPESTEVEQENIMVMGCRYLQKDGRCGQYLFRPAICREWPQIEWFGPPKILKGCGYRAVKRENKRNTKD